MITDYASLKTSVASWMNRDDLAPVIPDFIYMGENALYHSLRAVENEKSIAGIAATNSFTLPSDYLEAVLLTYGGRPLERISTQKVAGMGYELGVEGVPQYWARDEANLIVYPFTATDEGYEYKLVYWGSFPHLSDSNTTNALLSGYPELFLSHALIEAALYLGDQDGAQKWGAMAKRAVDKLNTRWYDENISGSTQAVSTIGGEYGA